MKKVYIFAVLCLSAFIFSACTSVEDKAKAKFEEAMKKIARNPSSVTFDDYETIYKSDSVCIIGCTVRGENGFGGMDMQRYEYLYCLYPDGDCGHYLNVGDGNTIQSLAKKFVKEWNKVMTEDKKLGIHHFNEDAQEGSLEYDEILRQFEPDLEKGLIMTNATYLDGVLDDVLEETDIDVEELDANVDSIVNEALKDIENE